MRTLLGLCVLLLVVASASCGAGGGTDGGCPTCRLDAGDGAMTVTDASDAPAACSPANCTTPGNSCRQGACVADCRPADAAGCPSGTVCDYTDGQCRAAGGACVLPAEFETCLGATPAATHQCGPGMLCDGHGSCINGQGCSGLDCDATGRCWAHACACDRPTPPCTPATLTQLNQSGFVGSPVNGSDGEGAFDLGFDDVCAAYTVTMISGPDYLRQLTADGTLTTWQSVSNLNMGEVAVLRLPGGELSTSLGDVAATYICCATCGCESTGTDGRLGVIRLDRTSTARPLPNVLAAMPTDGTAPFGNPTLDTGPYGLTWGGDSALYVGNVNATGDYVRVDLTAGTNSPVFQFPARVVASTVFDPYRLLIATQGGHVARLDIVRGTVADWATLPGEITSMGRDPFTGRVYAEIHSTPATTLAPTIVSLAADGTDMQPFEMPPRLGRITIGPDGYLYHLSVFPAVDWMAGTAIVRWPLPAQR